MSSSGNQVESDEEPDYLSDDFLAQCVKADVRPGLLMKQSEKRVHDQYKRKLEQDEINHKEKKSRSLEEGLKKEIGQDNKGFQMLQKMGFTVGGGIGKTESGRKDPIQVELKNNRLGIGHKTKKQEARSAIDEWKKKRDELSNVDDYRARILSETILKETMSDLRKAQKACRNLDTNSEKLEPDKLFFWPEVVKEPDPEVDEDEKAKVEFDDNPEEPEENEEDLLTPEEKLSQVESYLRNHYFYCIWCGINFESEEDIYQNCPGTDRKSH